MIPLTPWLDHLKQHVPIAAEGADPEGAHQLRVACRRLDVWLEMRGARVLRDDLRWLRGRAGQVRDLDVLLAGEPPQGWAVWLGAKRRRARRELVLALKSLRLDALLLALSLLPPLDDARARGALAPIARRAIELGDRFEHDPHDTDAMHRLRRSLRVLRYALEWIDEPTDEVREAQETFGEAADLSVALELMGSYPRPAELADERARAEEALARCRRRSLDAWRRLRGGVKSIA
jgi:CHAD domain-containing protein